MDEKLHKLRHDTNMTEDFFTKMMAYTLGPVELKEMMEKEHVKVLDVRDCSDYKDGHIPGAISIPRPQLDARLDELYKDDLYVVYCYNQQCHLAICACRLLASNGYPCMHLDGGYKVWIEDFKFAVSKD